MMEDLETTDSQEIIDSNLMNQDGIDERAKDDYAAALGDTFMIRIL